ncbi:phosphatidate cytidylyltransferase [Candidatus Kinetoplastibacterium desouzaii TCC079E]|uniref:Phosphatidate cytidylyltransferase n=1 Tax=Candidatus Kinetoplastidibacterium desouzai TCC079E TaxID=1208919 RepID=M1LUA6_9PROT|nr:phosphatidate cytidylyltransferase [Candidatus Kinetoplastibacterium desouzaii]AGF46879.1 phosphatidate cytidylyltransferase [Candidatus Kinetoplastibacterium desouzaii TCC079E]
MFELLKQRFITALLLLLILSFSLLSDNKGNFILLITFLVSMVFLEWTRMSIFMFVNNFILYFISFILFSCLFIFSNKILMYSDVFYILLFTVCAIWLLVATISIIYARRFCYIEKIFWSLFSIPACLSVWFSVVLFYVFYGSWFLLSLLIPVWIIDILGYFSGKLIGKVKLAPLVSPGKTIEGSLFGLFFAFLWFILSAYLPGSFACFILEKYSLFVSSVLFFVLCFSSIVGDLFESLLKRNYSLKDSSNFLPGHGGFFDRLDSIIPFLPIAIMISGVIG